ncbi:MAG: CRISPR-associated protein Cas4 [Candidatus Altiarchaeota archaeon]|nr:CRISPR-associated protein Cas4 [Candidatus Altiarchaeota archaeon]
MKVTVSMIREHEFCPRSVYLRNVLKIIPVPTEMQSRWLAGHAIRRELSLRGHRLLDSAHDSESAMSALQEELSSIVSDLPFIYRGRLPADILDGVLPDLESELEPELSLMARRLVSLVRVHGLERAREISTPRKVAFRISSEDVGLTGVVDKVMSSLFPVVVKTGRAGGGVWEADRLQLCAYGMLVEESYGECVREGAAEYARVQEMRPVVFTEQLRRKVFEFRDAVREILSGFVPDVCPHGNGKKCASCVLNEECYKI